MSTECEFFADALVDRSAGTLDEERSARLETHLGSCPDCADAARVIGILRVSPVAIPTGLEGRIRAAVREAAGSPPTAREAAGRGGAAGRAARRWQPWALPLATAAAAVGIWVGVTRPDVTPPGSDELELASLGEANPYGAWPAGDLFVAGAPVLSELSMEELERLLEEMGP
jgi:anti-sigma factor RsiW